MGVIATRLTHSALSRWNGHPCQRNFPPGSFIDVRKNHHLFLLPSKLLYDWLSGLVLEWIRRSGTRNSSLAVAIYWADGSSERLPRAHFMSRGLRVGNGHNKKSFLVAAQMKFSIEPEERKYRLLCVTKALSTLDSLVCLRLFLQGSFAQTLAEVSPWAQLPSCGCVMWEMQ